MDNDTRITTIKLWLEAGSINLFGRPFAGKDTQGSRLRDALGGVLLGGGDILRGSSIPSDVATIMRSGRLIPTDQYVSIVLPYLSQTKFEGKPLILSSVGRWHGEESGVIDATHTSGHPLKVVIYLRLDESVVVERWRKSQSAKRSDSSRGQRHDDTEEILKIRLAEYRNKTLPVIEFYRKAGLLVELDGSLSPEKVHQAILEALANRALATP